MVLISFLISQTSAEAYKVYWYDDNGDRVYHTVTKEETDKNKKAPRRAFIRCPRTNWEITPAMRARKRPLSQFTHRN